MQGIHSLCEARRERKREKEGGDEEGGKKERERERRMNETKLFGSTGFIYSCTFLTYPHTASAGADRG